MEISAKFDVRSFTLEKAYDTTWKHGIMKDLSDAGIRGRLPMFIQGFLQNRQFQVRLGSHMSNVFKQEMGVPQGSILSVTLFALKINSYCEKSHLVLSAPYC